MTMRCVLVKILEVMTLQDSQWKRFEIDQFSSLIRGTAAPWWVAGGLAIDLFLGRTTRTHEDLDIVIDREDQKEFLRVLSGWDLRATHPPGTLQTLKGNLASPSANAIWCRENESAAWRFEFLLAPFSSDEWIYRRTAKIRGPRDSFGWKTSDGVQVISPEIQLLYKSKARRLKDEEDFQNCWPALDQKQKAWLKEVITIEHGSEHPWALLE